MFTLGTASKTKETLQPLFGRNHDNFGCILRVDSLCVALSIDIMQIYYCYSQSIAANRKGELALKVETDLATITTHFKDLEQPSWSKCFCFRPPILK